MMMLKLQTNCAAMIDFVNRCVSRFALKPKKNKPAPSDWPSGFTLSHKCAKTSPSRWVINPIEQTSALATLLWACLLCQLQSHLPLRLRWASAGHCVSTPASPSISCPKSLQDAGLTHLWQAYSEAQFDGDAAPGCTNERQLPDNKLEFFGNCAAAVTTLSVQRGGEFHRERDIIIDPMRSNAVINTFLAFRSK
jgi:hypothetical protein